MIEDKSFFNYVKLLNIKANFLSTEFFAGEYESAFKGKGLEFEEIREYEFGDDIRLIDWKTTAKTGKLHVKKYHEEREISVILAVDISSSMEFGTKWQTKSELANEIAALISYTALKSNDKVGLLLFADKPVKFIPPRKGRNHIWSIIRTLVSAEIENKINDNNGNSIENALKFLADIIKRKSVIFLISDFITDDFSKTLKALKKRFDIVPVLISDKYEIEFFEKTKFFSFIEPEKFSHIFYKKENNVNDRLKEYYNYRVSLIKKSNIEPLQIFTHKPYISELIKYFRKRK